MHVFFFNRLCLKCGVRALYRGALAVWLGVSGWLALPGGAVAQPQTPSPAGLPIMLSLVESLSGPFANTGEAVHRNLVWAVERVNQRGGVRLTSGVRPLALQRIDNKGSLEESLVALKVALDGGSRIVLQGNSSSIALALVDALNKHNEREPDRRALFLNYSAVEPSLTNERCSFWHFRFDAHADMRLSALMSVLREDRALQRVYLIGQDYSFGQAVLKQARVQLQEQRPDIQIVGEELHPIGRVKDFLPYLNKIKASGAQAVITGNWGQDLTLMVKSAREVGYDGRFYTFYGNALGAPAAIGEAGVDRVVAVADWMSNAAQPESRQVYQAFRRRFPAPADDYLHLRMQLMIEALVQAMETADSTEAVAVARALEQVRVQWGGQSAQMRAQDHQFQQPLMVGVMQKQGASGVPFDVEGSGYGFRVVRTLSARQSEHPTTCRMSRP
jgi:branched-chain amino acid transport system substrate-binding protein